MSTKRRASLIRHGQSLWNAQNKFTGWVDVPLSERGRAEATIASCQLREKNLIVDVCFTSLLKRVIPFCRDRILTHIKEDDTVLIAAHGNSLRSIIMELENLTPEEVPKLELATGAPIVYEFDSQAQVTNKILL